MGERRAGDHRVTLIGGVIVLGLVLAGTTLFVVRSSWTYWSGASVTARVERCHLEGLKTGMLVCTGSWTLPDGRPGAGSIERAGTRDIGRSLPARATRSRATVAEPVTVYGTIAFCALFVAWGGALMVFLVRKARRNDAEALGS